MTAADRRAEIGEAGGDDGSEIAGAIDPNLHSVSSDRLCDQTRSLGSGACGSARCHYGNPPNGLGNGWKVHDHPIRETACYLRVFGGYRGTGFML